MKSPASFTHGIVLLMSYYATGIKNNSVYPGQLHNPTIVLLRRRLQIVNFPQFGSDISVGLLASHVILVVIPDSSSLRALALNFEHAGDIHLVSFAALCLDWLETALVLLFLVPVSRVPENYAV